MDTGIVIVSLTIFILACFAGAELIAKVPQILLTPLMSASNAISGIAILGALQVAGTAGNDSPFIATFGFLAVIFATINVVGGYLVTHRMLMMFKSRKKDTI